MSPPLVVRRWPYFSKNGLSELIFEIGIPAWRKLSLALARSFLKRRISQCFCFGVQSFVISSKHWIMDWSLVFFLQLLSSPFHVSFEEICFFTELLFLEIGSLQAEHRNLPLMMVKYSFLCSCTLSKVLTFRSLEPRLPRCKFAGFVWTFPVLAIAAFCGTPRSAPARAAFLRGPSAPS